MEGEKMMSEMHVPHNEEKREHSDQKEYEIWHHKVAEMKTIKEHIFNGISALLRKGIITDEFVLMGVLQNTIRTELQKHAGEKRLSEYALYHQLIGSTPLYELSPKLDFPDHKIMNFAKELVEKIHIANETGKFVI